MTQKMIPNCAALTIAGSDPGGGAGIQADLKTFSALGVFGTSVITAITAQNLQGVTAIQAVATDIVCQQLAAVMAGFPIKAIKTGMLFSIDIIKAVFKFLDTSRYRALPLIIDPVFAATSGSQLINDGAIDCLATQLFPLAHLVTPNIPEAERLGGFKIHSPADMEKTAAGLFKHFAVPILLKGGHLEETAVDILVDHDGIERYEAPMIPGVNNHGSGCTLSSAIAASIAKGESLRQAIRSAKSYISKALENSLLLLPDIRVINHFYE